MLVSNEDDDEDGMDPRRVSLRWVEGLGDGVGFSCGLHA